MYGKEGFLRTFFLTGALQSITPDNNLLKLNDRLHHQRYHILRKGHFYAIYKSLIINFFKTSMKNGLRWHVWFMEFRSHTGKIMKITQRTLFIVFIYVFIVHLKRLGSDDNNTSTADGLSPLKHVGPTTKFDKLYKTHKSLNVLLEIISKFISPMINQWEDSLCNDWHKSENTISKCLSFTLGGL